MRGHIYRRSKNSYTIVYDIGPDPLTGRRRQKSKAIKGTRKRAESELSSFLADLAKGRYVEPSHITLREFLGDWLRDYVRINVRPRTYERYEGLIRCQIVPAIGNIRLSDLTPLHINQAIGQWRTHGSADRKRGLSPQTCHNAFRVMRTALNHAVRWGLIPRNPAAVADAPRVPKTEAKALTEHEVARLAEGAGDSYIARLIDVAVSTGLRRAELLGLRWQDVDWDEPSITVLQTVHRLSGQGFVFQPPKTESSRRRVVLTRVAVAALRAQRARQAEERLRLGQSYENSDLVFASRDGRPKDQSTLHREFKRNAQKAGLPDTNLHMLRHTCASLHLRNGTHPKVVAEIMGHSSVGLTLDVYSHLAPEMQHEAVSVLDARLRTAKSITSTT